jgi:hypothetical protein
MLHFGAEEVIWECKTHRRSTISEHWYFPREVAPTVAQNLPKTWRSLVQDYTKLQFTLDTDKLVALYGTVDKVAMLRPDDGYMAGLWKNTLLQDLTWIASWRPSELFARPSYFQAPTLSWASIKSPVTFQHGSGYSVLRDVEVIDVHCPTTYTGCARGQDIENIRPTITIRGPLLAAKLTRKNRTRLPPVEDPHYYDVEVIAEFMAEFGSLGCLSGTTSLRIIYSMCPGNITWSLTQSCLCYLSLPTH